MLVIRREVYFTKKLFIVLSISLLLTVVGCSSQSSENTAVEQNNISSEVEETKEETEVFKKGSITDNVYINQSLNIKFVPTENMVMLTEEEMYESLQQGMNIVTGGDMDISDIDVVYELYLSNIIDNSNIQFTAEKLPLSQIKAEQYVEAIVTQLGQVDGFELISKTEVEDYDLCGLDFKAISSEMAYQGVSVKETIMCKVFGDRMLQLTISYFDDSSLDEILGCFSNIE